MLYTILDTLDCFYVSMIARGGKSFPATPTKSNAHTAISRSALPRKRNNSATMGRDNPVAPQSKIRSNGHA
jgi:hypothetical protein